MGLQNKSPGRYFYGISRATLKRIPTENNFKIFLEKFEEKLIRKIIAEGIESLNLREFLKQSHKELLENL